MKEIPVVSLVVNQVAEQHLDGFLVADQVVIDDEDDVGVLGAQGIQLGHHLGGSFEPRTVAEVDRDIAELALEGTAA